MGAKWGFLVYLAGNNSLSEDAGKDLAEMAKVGSSADVRVLAFVKQRGEHARHLEVGKNGHGGASEDLGSEVDSGNPQTVINFIRWAVERAPADRYALVLWNHGGGWMPDDLDQLYSEVKARRGLHNGVNRHELNHRASQPMARSVFSTTVASILEKPTESERQICNDDGTGHSLDTVELGRVIDLAVKTIGRPFDVLGMDACLMSALEVGFEVRTRARVIVGSEELEPGAGWCYDAILQKLAANPTMDGRELGRTIVNEYIASYGNQQTQWPVTQCALDAKQYSQFSNALDGLERALRPNLASEWLQVYRSQIKTVSFQNQLRDVNSFCRNLAALPVSQSTRTAARAVVDSLAPGSFVIAEGHLGAKVEACGGVSAYFPTPNEPISQYYRDLKFSKAHRWDSFLKAYQRAAAS
jgi:Clostripain family